MRTTRPLLELRSSGALTLVTCLSLLGGASASCSSSDAVDEATSDSGDAADVATDTPSADVAEAGTKDAALVDATPLPIRCETEPCAVALTSTMESESFDGDEGYCALLSDGTVACWGANTAGQLGNGETNGVDSAVAVRVPGLSGIAAIDHTCAVDGEGAVWCWGKGPFVENDASPSTVVGSPLRIELPGPAAKVGVGRDTACAVLRDERVACWGSNLYLQIGPDFGGKFILPQIVPIRAGVKSLAVGFAAFAHYDDGTISSWGANPGVGRATSFDRDSRPSRIQLDHLTHIDTIDVEACAVANGVGWCWGEPNRPAFGSNPNGYQRAMPVAVDTPEPIAHIAVARSGYAREYGQSTYERPRWCATSVTGAVYCWGLNNSGQAGDGTKQFALAPVRAVGLPAPAAEVKIMPYSTCTILTNGKVYCWGNNSYGQVGGGLPKGSVLTPTAVRLP